jgi:hypothetical protein
MGWVDQTQLWEFSLAAIETSAQRVLNDSLGRMNPRDLGNGDRHDQLPTLPS